MAKSNFMNSVSRSFHKVGFQIKKHSPEILLVTGVVGTVASAVLACKATTKINTILEHTKEDVNTIHDCMEQGYVLSEENVYSLEDGKKDLTIVYAKTGVELLKLYGPALVLGAASIGCILASNNIIHKRNVALAAAYTAVDNSFKDYRGRVVERFGKELDKELKYNIRAKEVEETVVNEDGTETVVTKTVNVADPNVTYSIYAKCFDETCLGWEKDPEYNLMFLRQQQSYFNDLLKSRGHVYLNEVHDALGMPRTKAGQIVGWVYDPSNPDIDNYIDFGIYDMYKEANRNFVNGYERSIWLDFNVDGNIYDLMK